MARIHTFLSCLIGKGFRLALINLVGVGWCASALAADGPTINSSARNVKALFAGEALLIAGEDVQRNVLFIIEEERIAQIVPDFSASDDDGAPALEQFGLNASDIVDLGCCFVLPGLIDVQTHIQSQRGMASRTERLTQWSEGDLTVRAMVHAERTLYAGFTTIRDMGHDGESVFAVRDAINNGLIAGPRMQVAGEIIRPTGGGLRKPFRKDIEPLFASTAICNGPSDCQRAVRAEVARGADTIKVSTTIDLTRNTQSTFDFEELVAIREAAHRLGRKVTASAFSTPSIELPMRANFDAVVHGTFLDDDALRIIKRNGAYYIPTLGAAQTVREMAEDPNLPFDRKWREENLAIYEGMTKSFRMALARNVKIAFGTDAGWRPHGMNALQFEEMVDHGMSSAEAIKTATINAADAIGWKSDVGSLEVGKYADLIAVRGSPIDDVSQLKAPVFVMKGGVIIRQESP